MDKIKSNLIEKAEAEIAHSTLFIGFYNSELKKEKDTTEQGKISNKIHQLEAGIEFNQKVLDYLKSL